MGRKYCWRYRRLLIFRTGFDSQTAYHFMTTVIPDFEEDKVNITFKCSFTRNLITELKQMHGINIKEELIRFIMDEIKK